MTNTDPLDRREIGPRPTLLPTAHELLSDEIDRLRDVIRRAARDLYVAEIHRQGVGWDDYCTDLLVRSQHALAAETKP